MANTGTEHFVLGKAFQRILFIKFYVFFLYFTVAFETRRRFTEQR